MILLYHHITIIKHTQLLIVTKYIYLFNLSLLQKYSPGANDNNYVSENIIEKSLLLNFFTG